MVKSNPTPPAISRAKPAPLDIATRPPAYPSDVTPFYHLGSLDAPDRDRLALLMSHSPALLFELKAAVELLLQVCDHHRQGAPLPSPTACRRVAMDALNVIGLAEGTYPSSLLRFHG